MKVVGLLPAAGSASRVQGLPKFLLPITENGNLISKHVSELLEVCDEVLIATRNIFVPLIQPFVEDSRVEIFSLEPSNMVKAVNYLISLRPGSKYLVGMPDTYFKGEINVYKFLKESSNHEEIALAAFPFRERMKGLVGQIAFDNRKCLIDLRDKVYECEHNYMWGAFALSCKIPENFTHPGAFFQHQINSKKLNISCIPVQAEYYDLGTVENVISFYQGFTK